MLSRIWRFHGHNSLNYAYQNGTTVRSDLFSVRIADNKRRKNYRCAVVVSKKVSKSAVVRNRIRRRLYEAVRVLVDEATPALDIIITVFKPEVATVSSDKLMTQLEDLLVQSKVVSKSTTSSHATIDSKEN